MNCSKVTLITTNPVRLPNRKFSFFNIFDTETSGLTSRDQITEFAGIRTDSNLNIIEGTETEFYIKPRIDVIPTVSAYLVTKIDIKDQINKGISELDAATKIMKFFTDEENSAVCGYNTINFDNFHIRSLFYRHHRDIYGHEWKFGNGNVDFYQLIKLAYAYLPNSLNFKHPDEDTDSLKLENLCRSNNITHENAHAALSDVIACAELAKRVKQYNEKLFNYFLSLSDKNNIKTLLNSKSVLLYTDSFFGKENFYTTPIIPIYVDNGNMNKYICINLRGDIEHLLDLSADDLRKYLFTKRTELEENSPIIPALTISANKQPLLRQITDNLTGSVMKRFNLNRQEIEKKIDFINKNFDQIKSKLMLVFQEQEESKEADAYDSLYDGFFTKTDNNFRTNLLATTKGEINLFSCDVFSIHKKVNSKQKIFSLVLRSKWNSFYRNLLASGTYSPLEMHEWLTDLKKRISLKSNGNYTASEFNKELDEVRMRGDLDDQQLNTINSLDEYVNTTLMNQIIELSSITKDPTQEQSDSYRTYQQTLLT